jgi:hypothetical protein
MVDFDMPVYRLSTAGDIPVDSKSSLVDEDEDLYEDLYGEETDEDMGYDGQLKAAFYSRNNIYYFN